MSEMLQNLRLFQSKFVLNQDCVDLDIDDLQFRKLRLADTGAQVLIQCKVSAFQQQDAKVSTQKAPALTLRKKYEQILGPGVQLQNIEVLEVGDGQSVTEMGVSVKPGDNVVLSGTTIAAHGWGKAVGYREEN